MANELAAVQAAEKALASARTSLREKRSRRRIMCSCGKHHAIGRLDLLVTHWYTGPHGCTGGDYWNEGEWQFICPVTGVRNRLLFNDYDLDWKDHSRTETCFKQIYRGLFKSSKDTYRDDNKGPWQNNYYIDRNRLRFELPARTKK